MRQPLNIGLTEYQEKELTKLSSRTDYSKSAIIRCALGRLLKTTKHQRMRWAIAQLKEVNDQNRIKSIKEPLGLAYVLIDSHALTEAHKAATVQEGECFGTDRTTTALRELRRYDGSGGVA
jgi:hypothetical protein